MLKQFALTSSLAIAALLTGNAAIKVPKSEAPAYTANGSLVAPVNYREWVFLSTGIDMSYNSTQDTDHHTFNNTFVNPTSYRAFLATGTWPDKTTIVLENRGAESPTSINKRGHTQSAEVMGLELHVKDNGKWLFYDVDSNVTKVIPQPASCYTCHEAHAAVDTTFVQFYPTLLPIAKDKNTFSAAYLKEAAEPVPAPTTTPAAADNKPTYPAKK
jgi:hypothetical protein